MEDAVFNDENKLVARRFVEEFWNQGRMEVADELVAPGCIVWDQPIGPEGFKQFFTVVKAAFPDLQFGIEDIFAEDDKVAMRFVEHGTHQGEWAGIPATGKQITVPGIAIFRIAGGQIVQHWFHNDFGAEMQQLGARIVPGDE